jgi:inhibitor of cysteine peptidase
MATTWNSENNLFILDNSLNICGSVTGLAKGEQIYSVRLIGDKGYIVTYRTMDPLFVFDLSDPKNPKVTGELKIPGFSNYLHPVGNNLILGIEN